MEESEEGEEELISRINFLANQLSNLFLSSEETELKSMIFEDTFTNLEDAVQKVRLMDTDLHQIDKLLETIIVKINCGIRREDSVILILIHLNNFLSKLTEN